MRVLTILVLAAAAWAQPQTAQPAPQPVPAPQADSPKQYAVPAGTKVLLTLQAPINTGTAQPGNGVYLQTIFPVVVDNSIVIPVGSFVQGTIDRVERPGKVKGRAQVLMHFTTLIFPNGYTVSLPAALDDVPGADGVHRKDQEGTLEHDSEKGRDAARIGEGAAAGAIITAGTRNLTDVGIGTGAGAVAGTLVALFTKGNNIRIDAGSQVEMVLQRPLTLEEHRLQAGSQSQQMVPLDNNRVLPKPQKPVANVPQTCRLPVCY